jgi:hypothetical protein
MDLNAFRKFTKYLFFILLVSAADLKSTGKLSPCWESIFTIRRIITYIPMMKPDP